MAGETEETLGYIEGEAGEREEDTGSYRRSQTFSERKSHACF